MSDPLPPPLTLDPSEPPGVLQYSAYVFDFHTCICGPLIFYSDFSEYISGAKLRRIGLRQYPSAAVSDPPRSPLTPPSRAFCASYSCAWPYPR